MDASSPVVHSVGRLSEAVSAFDQLVRLLCKDLELLKGLTWRRVVYTFLVAAGLALYAVLANWMRAKYGPGGRLIGLAGTYLDTPTLFDKGWAWLILFRVYLLLFFSQMVALTIADNVRIPRIPRTVVLVAGLILGTTVGSVAVMTSGQYVDWPPAWGLTWGGLIALVYFKRRRDEELAAALHATQLGQVELKKNALESRLQLQQAQVEPQFLFNTLQRVGDLYETDRQSADRMLDSLIVYLRAALPQMRTSSSTLGQEVQLAQAYLNIERIRRRGRLDFSFYVPEGLASARLPTMLVLPLIEALVVHGTSNEANGDETLRAEAREDGGMLKVTVACRGTARSDSGEIERIRVRLSALYGAEGTLRVDSVTPDGAVAALELPYVGA